MKTLRLITSTLLAGVIAVPYADAQITVGSSAADLPTPQGTIGATAPNVGGASSSISLGNSGPGNAGPGAVGPGRLGPGAYGPGNMGPGAFIGGASGPADIGLSVPTGVK
jgi:hypothetical protein